MDSLPSSGRHPWDYYETPPWHPLALLDYSPWRIEGTVCEVASGDNAIAEVLRVERPDLTIITNDLDPDRPTDYHFDARNAARYPDGIDWVVTNPPYRKAEEIVRASLEQARIGVAMLLRSTWAELANSRYSLLTAPNAPTCINLSHRYCFRRGKNGDWQTDSVPHWWFVWHKPSPAGSITILPTSKDLRHFTRNPDETRALFPEGYRAFRLGGGLNCTEPVSDRHLQPSLWSPPNGFNLQPPSVHNQRFVLAENPTR